MKTGACYVRVSTDEQMDFSPRSQLNKLREYAAQHDIRLPAEYVFMEEEGRSGRSAASRPQFLRMIRAARQKPRPFEVILVWKYSRFARSREDSILYKSMLRRQCGIEVVSVTEPLAEDKTSILMEALIEAMDEYYSLNLAEEVRRGMAERAGRGLPVSAPPFGYRMCQGALAPDPATAAAVRLMYGDFLSGSSAWEIAGKLNALGIPTQRGGRWQARTVRYVLANPAYAGKIRWGAAREGEPPLLAAGKHPPLVQPGAWEAAQRRLAALARPCPSAREAGAAYMLQGLVRCSACGSTLVRTGKGLQCHAYGKGLCPVSHYITLEQANRRVLSLVGEAWPGLCFSPQSAPPPAAPQDEAALYKRRLAGERRRLARARAAYEGGVDTLEEYRANKRRIEESISALLACASQAAPPPPAPPPRRGYAVGEVLASPLVPEADKNRLLRAFVRDIVFDRRQNRLLATFYF